MITLILIGIKKTQRDEGKYLHFNHYNKSHQLHCVYTSASIRTLLATFKINVCYTMGILQEKIELVRANLLLMHGSMDLIKSTDCMSLKLKYFFSNERCV